MASSLWRPFRLLPRLQSTFSHSLGLRACTPLQSRLLHSSSVFQARKPTKAVVKPVNASATTRKKQRAQERKQFDTPFETQSPTTTPSVSATPPPTTSRRVAPPPTIHQPITNTTPKQQPIVEQSTESVSTPPPSPLKPTLGYVAGGHSGIQATLRELAAAESPTLIYEATKTRQYVAWCMLASLLFGGVAALQISFFTTEPSRKSMLVSSVFLITFLMWASLASWAAFGSSDVIKRIWALPSATGKPLLRIEPVRVWAGRGPRPFDVRIGDVFSDKSFEQSIAMFNAAKHARRQSGVFDTLFGPIRTIMSANMKMIQRKASFARLRINNSGIWKVDLRDCRVPDHGRTLDLLILPDEIESNWLRKLFVRED